MSDKIDVEGKTSFAFARVPIAQTLVIIVRLESGEIVEIPYSRVNRAEPDALWIARAYVNEEGLPFQIETARIPSGEEELRVFEDHGAGQCECHPAREKK